ncbi:MAG: Periplasmic (Fe) hydrogenase large subunit [Firmicutes bacterium]|nr:Periplasmic (Fe) hydrogenase large subunit [candidate division NPL-UPA2 bacterium]
MTYFHSVKLHEDKCKGCTNCIKRCPTEAIRVRGGRAVIDDARCVDCGECIRVCPNRAKSVVTDSRALLKDRKFNACLVAPSFFGQFRSEVSLGRILASIKSLGFSHVLEVSRAADVVASALSKHLLGPNVRYPALSTSCPAVVRLVQVRFPDLIDHFVPFDAPMEIAAYAARQEIKLATGCSDDEIGVFFTTPCPAKVTAVHQPVGQGHSQLTGALSMAEVYADAFKFLPKVTHEEPVYGSARGLAWAVSGGEGTAIAKDDYLAVDGLQHVIALLEEVELGRLRSVKYIEGQACIGGCVGGVLAVGNPFIARLRIARMSQRLVSASLPALDLAPSALTLRQTLLPRPFLQLDANIEVALQKLNELEALVGQLPMLDCGACGAPHCRALAEDIVRGTASSTDCVFVLRKQVSSLAGELMDLAGKLPPAMGRG